MERRAQESPQGFDAPSAPIAAWWLGRTPYRDAWDLQHRLVAVRAAGSIGDQLLVGVAARLQELVRAVDTVARPGGDEFLIILDIQAVFSLEDLSVVEAAAETASAAAPVTA